jgi:DNA-binding beta-propeller fold protein YncE
MADLTGMLQAAAGSAGGGGPAEPYDITALSFTGSPLRIADLSSLYPTSTSIGAEDIQFNSNGTKCYVVGRPNFPLLMQFSLRTAYSFAGATYDGELILRMGQCFGFTFKADGTELYVISSGVGAATTDSVWAYSLSTAYDITTATPLFNNFNFTAPVGVTEDLFFKPDGTALYTVNQADDVVEYALSTAWDVSTTSYVRQFDANPQDADPVGLFFKPDGTKMYVLGAQNDSVYEYDLSTAWNVGTASYLQSFSVFAQTGTAVESLAFSADGTKMYVVSSTNDAVYQYTLSTAWDISSSTYLQSFSVAGQETAPTGIFFKSDGTKMYVCGNNGDDVNEYDLSTAWDISSASYVQNFSAPTGNPSGVALKSDGSVLYFCFFTAITQQTLGTPYDVSTATAWAAPTTGYINTNAQETASTGLFFKPDGTKMYTIGTTGDSVDEYALSTAWDLTTATATSVFSVSSQETSPEGIFFKSDGTKMYVCGIINDAVNEYALSTAWDITSASYTTNTVVDLNPTGLAFSSDGTLMAVTTVGAQTIYTLSTAWDVSSRNTYVTLPTTKALNLTPQDTVPNNAFFKPDGTELYTSGNSNDAIYQYSLSSAFDISTASYTRSFSVVSQTTAPTSVAFKTDGTKMYVTETVTDSVLEYSLSTAWDISSASYSQAFSVATQETVPNAVTFKPDGTKMYVTGTSSDSVNEYALSTAWDVSSASFTTSFSTASQDTNPISVLFNTDGTKMFVCGSVSDQVYEYALSTAYDVSSASYTRQSNLPNVTPIDLAAGLFNNDGTKMYAIAAGDTKIFLEYDIV